MGEVPAGAVIAQGGEILSVAANRTVRDKDATAHAELVAIREACQAGLGAADRLRSLRHLGATVPCQVYNCPHAA